MMNSSMVNDSLVMLDTVRDTANHGPILNSTNNRPPPVKAPQTTKAGLKRSLSLFDALPLAVNFYQKTPD